MDLQNDIPSNSLRSIDALRAFDKNEVDWHRVIEDLDVAIYACNNSGLITFYNDAAVSLWGRKPEIGKDMWSGAWKLFSPDGTPISLDLCPMAIALKEGKIVESGEFFIQRPDGTKRYVKSCPKHILDINGKIIGAASMLVDITAKKETELKIADGDQKYHLIANDLEKKVNEKTYKLIEKNKELEKSEERYHKMIDEVQDYAILSLDKNGIILNWNKGAEKIKGYNESEIVGKSFKVFYLPKQLENKIPEKLLAEAELNGRAEHEGWRKRKNGSIFWGSVVITALHDEQMNVIGFSKVTRDLTERKQTEDRLKQYNHVLQFQNKELEQFAYIASHDLQEPLRKIQLFSEILDKNIDDKNTVKKYLSKINFSTNKLSELVKAILNYSRLTAAKSNFEDVDLNEIVKSVCDDFELALSQKQAHVTYSKLPFIKGNAVQLHQLFSNLLSNSLKFCNANPLMDISWEKPLVNEISNYMQMNPDTGYIKIIFKDDGIGFEQQYAEKIFNLFNRLDNNSPGTGIGLTICKKIIENHGGYINAISERNKGATFNIYLPG